MRLFGGCPSSGFNEEDDGKLTSIILPICDARIKSKKSLSLACVPEWACSSDKNIGKLRTRSGTPPVNSMQPSIGIHLKNKRNVVLYDILKECLMIAIFIFQMEVDQFTYSIVRSCLLPLRTPFLAKMATFLLMMQISCILESFFGSEVYHL